jgi:hypothetical protein
MSDELIEQAPHYTGFVLAVRQADGQTKLLNVSEQEWRKHRQLGACDPRAAETRVISRWDIF